jgi:NAD+ kinase
MQTQFNTVAIIGKFMRESAVQLMRKDLADLAQHLQTKNMTVLFEVNTAEHAQY